MADDHGKAITLVERDQGQLAPVVQMAMANNPDPATLEKLLDLQERWERGVAKKAFTRALVGLKRDLPTVLERDQTVDFPTSKGRTHYTHTSLAAVMAAITEPLTQHGFALSWKSCTKDRLVSVACHLQHSEGHSEETVLESQPDTSGSKGPAQAIASTITLLQRYTALSLLGIATADMQEPAGPQELTPEEASGVDQSHNLRAAAALQRYGKTRGEVEERLGRTIDKWTAGDLAKLREWRDEMSAAKKAAAAQAPPAAPADPRTAEQIAEGYDWDQKTGEVVPPVGANN